MGMPLRRSKITVFLARLGAGLVAGGLALYMLYTLAPPERITFESNLAFAILFAILWAAYALKFWNDLDTMHDKDDVFAEDRAMTDSGKAPMREIRILQ